MRIMALGDTHFPFTRWDALEAAADFAKSYKPDLIIQVGDFIDAHNWSKWTSPTDAPNSHDEWNLTIESVGKFQHMFRKWPVVILEGNHCRRAMMRATESKIPKQLIKTMDEMFTFDNFTWHMSHRPFMRDGVYYIHGDEMGGNAYQKAQRAGHSIVQGHDHAAYLHFINTFERQIFGMSIGAFLDPSSVAGRYAAKNLMKMWCGWSTITDSKPHLYSF